MNVRRLIEGSVLSSFLLFLQIGIAFFLTPYLIHSLGDRDYGIWIVMGTIIGYYGVLDLGISGAVQRYISRAIGSGKSEEKRIIVSTSFYIFSMIGLIILLVTIILSLVSGYFVINRDDIPIIRLGLLSLGVGIGLTFPFRIFIGVIQANLRFDVTRYIEIVEIIIRTILIVMVLRLNGGILWLAIVTSLSTICYYLVIFIVSFKIDQDISIRLKFFAPRKINYIFSYSTYTFIAQIAKMLSEKSGPLIIAKVISTAAVTAYSVAFSFILYFMQLIWSVLGVIGPVFSQSEGANDIDTIRYNYIFITKISLFLSLYCGLMAILYGDKFIFRWLGSSYSDSALYLQIMMIPMTINLGLAPIYYLLNNISKHQVLSVVQIIEGGATVILSVVLSKHYGTIGVVLGFSLPLLFLSLFVRPIIACKTIKISMLYFCLNIVCYFILLAIIFIVPIWLLLDKYITESYALLILAGIFQFVLYSVGVLIFGFNSKERIRIVKHLGMLKYMLNRINHTKN